MTLSEEEQLRQKSARLVALLDQFASEVELYDTQALAGVRQQELGVFYDYRIGMEKVYRLQRVYSEGDGRVDIMGSRRSLTTVLFGLTKKLDRLFAEDQGLDVVVDPAGMGRVSITLYFSLEY
ncbi:MAG: hypothetical protein RRB13_13285 [bacterium]|nr:hypothetical protein [bacterium]